MSIFSNNQISNKDITLQGGDKQITNDELKSISDNVSNVANEVKDQKTWIHVGFIALVFVAIGLVIAVYSILVDHVASKQAVFEDMRDQILRQNIQLEILNQDMQKLLSKPTK